jgi:hypothetical protein
MFPGLAAAGLGPAGMPIPGFPGGAQPYGWMPGAATMAVPGQEMGYGAPAMGAGAPGFGYPVAPVPADATGTVPAASAVLSPMKQPAGAYFQV